MTDQPDKSDRCGSTSLSITIPLPAYDEPLAFGAEDVVSVNEGLILHTRLESSPPRANAEIKRLLCMAHETYDPKALDALTRALVAQGFGK